VVIYCLSKALLSFCVIKQKNTTVVTIKLPQITSVKCFKTWAYFGKFKYCSNFHGNQMIYRCILTLENVDTVENYQSIFITLATGGLAGSLPLRIDITNTLAYYYII
jgi:hypothetical protein